MRTDDITYIVVRFEERGITCAGTHLTETGAKVQADRLNKKRNKIHEAKWQVEKSTYYGDYRTYANLIDLLSKDELVRKAQVYGVATSGTKVDIATRICRRMETQYGVYHI